MLGNLFKKAVSSGTRVLGGFGETLRKVGDYTAKVVRGVGNFVKENHQPVSMLVRAVGDATGNDTLKTAGDLAMAGSAYMTTKGIGKDYTGLRNMMGHG